MPSFTAPDAPTAFTSTVNALFEAPHHRKA